jgi:ribosomal protein S18 acetylase RimI-like enzyme
MTELAPIKRRNDFNVAPLTPARRDAWLRFFDEVAFADNPRWQSCYCMYPHVDHRVVVWPDRDAGTNRSAACQRIDRAAFDGWLALGADGEVVGWCKAAPRDRFEFLADDAVADAAAIGRIVCFVVAPAWRRCGVARALLDAACAGFRSAGLKQAEGLASTRKGSAAHHHFGPLAMYLAAGFAVAAGTGDDDDSRVTLRKSLLPS